MCVCVVRLHMFLQVPRFQVLVCGGDGTVGWVLGVLEAIRHKLVCRQPPISIVPLGTGQSNLSTHRDLCVVVGTSGHLC